MNIHWIHVSDRNELAEPEWQAFLEGAGPDDQFLCGYCGNLALPLTRVLLPEGGYNLRSARNRRANHLPGCWVETEGRFTPTRDPGVVYPPGLFAEAAGTVEIMRSAGGDRSVGDGVWRGDMMHLLNSLLMRATVVAFTRANAGLRYNSSEVRSAPRDQIFNALAEMMHAPALADGASPLEEAARFGLRLQWGITREHLPEALREISGRGSNLELDLPGCWDACGPIPGTQTLRISAEVARATRGRMMAYRSIIPPPYLVFASLRGEHAVRLCVMPVATSREYLHVLDSGPERRFLEAVERQVGVLKPPVAIALEDCGADLWPFAHLGALPNRPDAIVFHGNKLTLVEVAGATSQHYREVVERRVKRYNQWRKGSEQINVLTLELKHLDAGLSLDFLKRQSSA